MTLIRLGGVQYQLQHLSVNGALGLVEAFQPGPIDTDRGEVAVDRAWPLVETFRARIEFFLAVDGPVRALWEVLAQATVGVLAGSPWPGQARSSTAGGRP